VPGKDRLETTFKKPRKREKADRHSPAGKKREQVHGKEMTALEARNRFSTREKNKHKRGRGATARPQPRSKCSMEMGAWLAWGGQRERPSAQEWEEEKESPQDPEQEKQQRIYRETKKTGQRQKFAGHLIASLAKEAGGTPKRTASVDIGAKTAPVLGCASEEESAKGAG